MIYYVPLLHYREKYLFHSATLPNDIAGFCSRLDGRASAFDEMWLGIAAKIEALDLPWKRTRIYQDGVPVCGYEAELVTRLAEGGCRNFLFIAGLLRAGAMIEGTEDWNLLLTECDLLNDFMTRNETADDAKANQEYQIQSQKLLARRDRFIFDRIKSTLKKGELSLVFMGILHDLDKLLEKEYKVVRINYPIPFQSVQEIYGT